MTFNPSTDVILGVANAADPARERIAAARLEALGAGGPAGDFAAELDQVSAAAPPAPLGLANARTALTAPPDAADKASRAKTDFEAMMLNSFVGELLPKDAGSVFGDGTAGEVWRSMLSEQIARQIAKSGALGLSRRLFATHELASKAPAVAAEASSAVEMSANILSAPSAAEIVDGAVLSAGGKRA